MATVKERALVNARLKVIHEPTIDHKSYNISLIHATNWYNTNNDSGDYRQWFVQHFGKKIDFPVSLVHDIEFRIAGVLARLLANGNELLPIHMERIDSEFSRIREIALSKREQEKLKVKDETSSAKKGPSIQEKMDEKIKDFMGEFNGLVDEFLLTGKNQNISGLIKTMGISGSNMGNKILEKIKAPVAELNELLEGEDKQLVEGWSNLKKPDQKKLLAVYQSLMDNLQQAKVSTPKKIRKVKAKPAGVIVQKLKFKKEDTDLKLKSIIPANIVGASEVWIFNIKNNKLQCYYAAEGTGISVKGTTLLNYSIEKSKQKTVRKPETVSVLNTAGKRTYSQYYKALTTKESDVNGRVNEECVILAAFK